MSDFTRYAVYYLPEGALSEFGASWLGWDVDKGAAVAQPDLAPLGDRIEKITQKPRKYGFHATLKPPFRLSEGRSQDDLQKEIKGFADSFAPVHLQSLALAQIGRFHALCPTGDVTALNAMAAACVAELDHLRAPLTEDDLTRRRQSNLSDAQDALLVRWGYPYVMEEFRFHMTLTGSVKDTDRNDVIAALQSAVPVLPQPFALSGIALVGERADGMFETIARYAFSG